MTSDPLFHRAWRQVYQRGLKGVRIVAPFALCAFPIALVRYLTRHPDGGTIVLSLAAMLLWVFFMLRVIRTRK